MLAQTGSCSLEFILSSFLAHIPSLLLHTIPCSRSLSSSIICFIIVLLAIYCDVLDCANADSDSR